MRLRPFVASLLVATACAQAPAKHPMTFADLQALHRISDPQVSPDHKWVIFSVTDVDLAKNTKTNHLWIVPFAGGPQTQLTHGSGESNGRFSPDGKFIAVTMDDQIYALPFNAAKGTVGKPEQITRANGGADGAIWSPDSKRLLFVVNVFPECSDVGDWSKEDACNAQKQKTADDSPVKAQIFTHLLYRHWNAFTGERRSHIAVVDADGRNLRDLTPRSTVGDAETPTFSLGGPLGYAWSPDGKEIAYETNLEVGFAQPGKGLQPGESTNNDIFTLRLDESGATPKKVSTSPGSDDGPLYSPDGKYLAWRSQARNGYESDKFDLVVMDRATGAIKNLTTKFDNWVDAFVWVDDSQHLIFAAPLHGMEPLYEINVDGSSLQTMSKDGGEWADFSAVLTDGHVHIVGTRQWVDHPTAVFNIDALQLSGKAPEGLGLPPSGTFDNNPGNLQLSHINGTVLHSLDDNPGEAFWFPGANGTRVEGFLIKPPHFDPSKKYPLKFLIHGGPQGAWGDSWSYRWNPELFAANGYVVVMINPRGSTGYGQRFLEEVSGDWGGRPFTDLMRGLDYAEAHYPFIDKTRECALGASYGGFMANWVLTHTNRFKCIVTHDGMYNSQSAFGDTEELWFNEWEFRPLSTSKNVSSRPEAQSAVVERPAGQATTNPDAVVEQTHRAYPWDFYSKPASEDPFRKNSPMQFIKNAKTPTLVVHGQRDYRLDVSEGMQLFTALQLLGVPSKMLYFPDEGHWVLKPQNSELWYKTVNDWCDQWTHTNAYAK